MGTNFYWLEKPPCPTCGHAEEGKHIGKSSVGWVFALHVYPEEGIHGLDDWIARFFRDGTDIRDEYGKLVPASEMVQRIAGRSAGGRELLRASPDGRHTLGHGPGTWDLHVGEFS